MLHTHTHTHTLREREEYYLAIKKNEILSFPGKLMEREFIKWSNPGSDVLCLMWKIYPIDKCIHKYKHEYVYIYMYTYVNMYIYIQTDGICNGGTV
jgi:hypothetical protein